MFDHHPQLCMHADTATQSHKAQGAPGRQEALSSVGGCCCSWQDAPRPLLHIVRVGHRRKFWLLLDEVSQHTLVNPQIVIHILKDAGSRLEL